MRSGAHLPLRLGRSPIRSVLVYLRAATRGLAQRTNRRRPVSPSPSTGDREIDVARARALPNGSTPPEFLMRAPQNARVP